MDRKLFQDTFSELHASEERIQEVLSMTEERSTSKTRRLSRAVLLTAAVAASLCVGMGAANAATDGALADAIESHILHINDYKSELKTEDGKDITVFSADVDLVREDDRVILTIRDERIDITDELNENGSYTCDRTDGETTCHIEIMPDDVDGPDARWYHPDEWRYEVTLVDSDLVTENGETSFSYIGSTYKDSVSNSIKTYSTIETDQDGNQINSVYFTEGEMSPEDFIELTGK